MTRTPETLPPEAIVEEIQHIGSWLLGYIAADNDAAFHQGTGVDSLAEAFAAYVGSQRGLTATLHSMSPEELTAAIRVHWDLSDPSRGIS